MPVQLPQPLYSFFSLFPLYAYPEVPNPQKSGDVEDTYTTLWVRPPKRQLLLQPFRLGALSRDVECLKWQAHIALKGIANVHVRWDISPDGAVGGRLPNLHIIPKHPSKTTGKPVAEKTGSGPQARKSLDELLPAHLIPVWVDRYVKPPEDDLEGYKDIAARDESRAWVALLEGSVHAALIQFEPGPSYLHNLLFPPPDRRPTSLTTTTAEQPSTSPLQAILIPPPAPLTGLLSLIPASGTKVSANSIHVQYKEAIAALAERLGTDKWFLGSANPTPLDALAFAYLHTILDSDSLVLRVEITRRINLVSWELAVRGKVSNAFQPYEKRS